MGQGRAASISGKDARKCQSIRYRFVPVPPDEPPFWLCHASCSDGNSEDTGSGWAADIALASAYRRAVCECIERLSIFDASRQMSLSGLPQNHNDEMLFPLSEIAGIPAAMPHTLDAGMVQWVPAARLTEDGVCRLPAELVYLLCSHQHLIRQPLTTGCASGETLENATATAVLEILERHAFIEWYVLGKSLQEILPTSDEHFSLLEVFAKFRLKLRTFALPQGPARAVAVMAVVFDETGFGPAVTAGLAAGFVAADTIRKAALEAWQPRIWLRQTHIPHKVAIQRTSIHSTHDRGHFWWATARLHDAERMLGNPTPVQESELGVSSAPSLLTIAQDIERAGHSLFRVTIPPVPEESHVYVVRVIAPSLQPLYLDEKFEHGCYERTPQSIAPHFFL